MLSEKECEQSWANLSLCVGNITETKIFKQLIEEHFKLAKELEVYKRLDEFIKNAERFYTNEDYFKIILKAISKCKDKDLADNAIHCLSYLKYQLEGNPALKVEELKEGMQVWDNVLKKYIHILTIDFGVPSGGLIETENEYVPFEERRFYRKQVEE